MKIKLTDDKEFAKDLKEKIKENGGYCLCALQKIDETKCMCKEFAESTELGPCHCGLYIKTEL